MVLVFLKQKNPKLLGVTDINKTLGRSFILKFKGYELEGSFNLPIEILLIGKVQKNSL